MDRITRAQRSKLMASIRSKDTKPELRVRSLIHAMGYRYRIHGALPGRPDLVFARLRKVIFVHGCYWHAHKCKKGAIPATNSDFWKEKFAKNRARDRSVIRKLRAAGWSALVVWECETKDTERLVPKLARFLAR